MEDNGNGNLGLAIVGGLVGAIVSAGAWAGITVAIEYQHSLFAIGVGILVGVAVKLLGRGEGIAFGLVGGFFALAACLVGNFLAAAAFVAQGLEIGFFETFSVVGMEGLIEAFKVTSSPIDFLFYIVAAVIGFQMGKAGGDE